MLALPVSRQQLKGEVEVDGFRIAKRIAYPSSMWALRSAFQTWASGTFTASGAGTTISVTLYVHPGVMVFWGVVLTLSLLVGLAAVTNCQWPSQCPQFWPTESPHPTLTSSGVHLLLSGLRGA